MSQAQWTVTQSVSVPPSLQSQLYRNLGLLAEARGEHYTAKKHFAEDVSYIHIMYCTVYPFVAPVIHVPTLQARGTIRACIDGSNIPHLCCSYRYINLV